jgi:hypothetical protein
MKVPLAKKHAGMRLSAEGLLTRVAAFLKDSGDDQLGYAWTLEEQLLPHLKEMASRFYAGDLTVVDEFLQLYDLDAERPKDEVTSNAGGKNEGAE